MLFEIFYMLIYRIYANEHKILRFHIAHHELNIFYVDWKQHIVYFSFIPAKYIEGFTIFFSRKTILSYLWSFISLPYIVFVCLFLKIHSQNFCSYFRKKTRTFNKYRHFEFTFSTILMFNLCQCNFCVWFYIINIPGIISPSVARLGNTFI